MREDLGEVKGRLADQGSAFVGRLSQIDDRWATLESDPRFLDRIKLARGTIRAGWGIKVEDL